jgi:hypothetical protein
VSIALFAIVAVIWVAIIVPSVRSARAERAAAVPPAMALRGDRLGRVRRLPAPEHRPKRRRRPRPAVVRRRRALAALAVAALAALRAWTAFGGRWWLVAVVAGSLPVAYLAALAVLARRRRHGRERRAAGRALLTAPAGAGWVASTE